MKKFFMIFSIMILLILQTPFQVNAEVHYDENNIPYSDEIIIAAPADGYTTTAGYTSILGSANPDYPLYYNGIEVALSEHGYFTIYTELAKGKNTFTFTSGDNEKTITITRTGSSSGGGSSSSLKLYSSPKYGIINKNNGSRRTAPDSSYVIITPLAKGTAFNILGEQAGYYLLSDGTFLAIDKIDVYNGTLDDNRVDDIEFIKNGSNNTSVLRFKMNINALYRTIVSGNTITLTLYDTSYGHPIDIPDNEIIRNISVTTDYDHNYTQYIITLYDKNKVTGIDVTFSDGYMNFALKKVPALKYRNSLNGATVILDAGHGGDDTGAVGPLGTYGPVEKDINLSITKYAEKYLTGYGATVILTRSSDEFISLYDRVNFIKDTLPDISISIHGNSMAYSANYSLYRGFLTYYSYNLYTSAPSMINSGICSKLAFKESAPRYKNLALTRLVNSPALLLETGFLSNPYDYEYLVSPVFQERIGKAVADSVYEYLTSLAVYSYEPVNCKLISLASEGKGYIILNHYYNRLNYNPLTGTAFYKSCYQ